MFEQNGVELVGLQQAGNAVDGVAVRQGHYTVETDVGKEGNFAAGVFIDGNFRAAEQKSGCRPMVRSSFTECWVGLVLVSPAVAIGHQGEVD